MTTMQIATQIDDWTTEHTERQCGDCFACCVHLGITELKKYPDQPCKHLDGALGPDKRCSIYAKRPSACAIYKCLWRQGIGPDWLRPADSGILITMYDDEGGVLCTAIIIDREKAMPHIDEVTQQLLLYPLLTRLTILDRKTKFGLTYHKGKVHRCEVKPNPKGDYEGLLYVVDDAWFGEYSMADLP